MSLASMIAFRGWLPLVAVIAVAAVATAAYSRSRPSSIYRRGAVVRGRIHRRPKWHRGFLARCARDPDECDPLTLAGRPVTAADESKHFKMIGTTGTGKSTAIRELVRGALERGDRVVFADPDGGYLDQFYRPYRGDSVLNPFEGGSVKWDPFAEIRAPSDVDELSAALIPPTSDPVSNEWRAYARTFVAALLRWCSVNPPRNSTQLWRLISRASIDELRRVTAGSPAAPFLETENGRMFGSIRSVAVSALAGLEYVQAQRSLPFSIREWIRDARGPGALFITYRSVQIATLRSLIGTWMRLAIFEALNSYENQDQRLWFVVDELDALGPIAGLKDALARLRKFGGRCVLGFQSIAQVSGTYGASEAQTIIENCGNTLILRCSGSENGGTSQFASRLIGEREMVRRQATYGSDRPGVPFGGAQRRSRSVSDQHVTEFAVMASEIEQLPDLTGFYKAASSPHWHRVCLRATGR